MCVRNTVCITVWSNVCMRAYERKRVIPPISFVCMLLAMRLFSVQLNNKCINDLQQNFAFIFVILPTFDTVL